MRCVNFPRTKVKGYICKGTIDNGVLVFLGTFTSEFPYKGEFVECTGVRGFIPVGYTSGVPAFIAQASLGHVDNSDGLNINIRHEERVKGQDRQPKIVQSHAKDQCHPPSCFAGHGRR